MPWAPEIEKAVSAAVPDMEAVVTPPLAVDEPPCRRCASWRPIIVASDGSISGIKLCHAKTMYSDFSCYTPKKY